MPAPASFVDHTPADFRLGVRVYWEDTDAGGVVFYANYLKFFERARTEWLRSLGHQQQLMRTRDGVMFVSPTPRCATCGRPAWTTNSRSRCA